ncbi:hypothetical protein OPT61_g5255 [Boeremia exigua]|uniref:Uncharacterized protein n=1 Tax=Boeremia exigua TaxID=749465 RepID=A0ACC2IAX6_9PLEO|nr:hypothetical protein OPT61_g5255 [Boeremia exigua]
MSELSNSPPVAHQHSLVLHTAVDFSHKGIGIGIVRSAAIGVARASTLRMEEHKHGVERGQLRAQNVKTRERAHMFALILAMGLACSTIKRWTTAYVKVQSVTVLCGLPAVVELIKHHRAHGPKSLESVVTTEDRSMMIRVLASVKRLSRYNVQVSVVEDEAEGNAVDAARAKVLAHQRKKKACRRRRQERRIMASNAETVRDEKEDGGSDREGNRAGDEEERRNDSSHPHPTTERELSSSFMMDETGEPELHWTRAHTAYPSASTPNATN